MKQNIKIIITTTGGILGISLSVFFLTFVVLAWTGPQHTPPTCESGEVGCDSPLHTGTTAQSKAGGLLLNTGGATNGLIVENGNVGIGVESPTAKLEVAGVIESTTGGVKFPDETIQTSAATGVPAGAVMSFAMDTCPSGWIKANGSAVSRTTYSDLFGAISTIYGVGDGSTTFNLPDYRGEFLRGWDDGRGVDTGRSIGTAQGDAIRNITGSFSSSGIYGEFSSSSAQGAFYYSPSLHRKYTSTAWVSGGMGFDASLTVPTAEENRPRNISVLYCIKY